jgi:gliding motility-associated-like protein
MRYLLLLILLMFMREARATHVMGGEITWTCQGGNYIFELVFYRNCNGVEVNTVMENIRVWHHPTITNIIVNFISRVDISPTCTPVPGSPPALDCGVGSGGGNGIGAIEKITYRSNPIALPGIAPADGWVFTYENFSRSNDITNLINPSDYGITLSAYMFPIPGAATGCVDNSPKFLQEPYFVSCAGTPYVYNMNPVDADLDSLAISFGYPLDYFPTGIFDPPDNPQTVPFQAGFDAGSPTPNATFNPGNVPANIDPNSGELTFTSFTTGSFTVKLIVKAFRRGVMIAQVEREMQLVVVNCLPTNQAPVIAGPFAGLFETTITAGDPISFNLSSTDVELLQDGSPQNNILTASGLMFGTNFTSPAGCDILPCATLNATPAITGVQGVTTNFNWQTSCDHLVNQYGIVADLVPYNFVFKIQDNYCQVPKVTYATVTIHVRNPGIIPPADIDCIQTAANGDLTLHWTPVADPSNSFAGYEVYSVQNGLLASIPAIGTTSYTVPAIHTNHAFFLRTISGCAGNVSLSGDTVSNIQLTLFNPNNGTAMLSWNPPVPATDPAPGSYYHIYREFPAGNWTLIDSVAYGTTAYKDTIDICEAFLNYQVVLPAAVCDFTSNIQGDDFEDMLTPDIPVIQSVSIDTLTNLVTITWNINAQPDTYGYVVYQANQNGILFEIDTVWGRNNVTYTFGPNTDVNAIRVSIAAFDSCFTNLVPPTYQTSAKANVHTTMFLSQALDVCTQTATLSWTAYGGWNNLVGYEVYGREDNGPWNYYGATDQTNFSLQVVGLVNYTFAIRAINTSGSESFSNRITFNAVAPSPPNFNYTQVATVENEIVVIRHYVDAAAGVSSVLLERKNTAGDFESILEQPVVGNLVTFVDTDVATERKSYTYRARIVDSCGNPTLIANEVTTILLEVQTDELALINYLNWSPYYGFDGSILNYAIYRGIGGVFDPTPIALVSAGTFNYLDDVNAVSLTNGKICYYVEALESFNSYGFAEIGRSNVVCPIFTPLIYIPNAFTPGGSNSVFLPIVSLVDPADYRFTVFDRWGQVIFQSTTIGEGWDGKHPHNNQVAETGTYNYVLQVKDGNGQEVTRRGHVSLLR